MKQVIKQPIQHIVLSGGAYLGLYEFGALKYLCQHNFYKIENIKSIHGTSIGGLIGAILCLNMEWDTIHDYIVKRPWNKMIQIMPNMLFDIIPKKGLFGYTFFENIMSPLLKTCDIDIDVTLLQFYEKTQKELFLYTVDLNHYTLEKLSHRTTPELPLIQALYMTCCLPYVFQPVWYKNRYYIDGGLLNNYPLDMCVEEIERHREEKEGERVKEGQREKEGEKKEKCELNQDIVERSIDNPSIDMKLYNAIPDITREVKQEEEETKQDQPEPDQPEQKQTQQNQREQDQNQDQNQEDNPQDTILGIKFMLNNNNEELKEESNIFEYGYFLYRKMVKHLRKRDKPTIYNELIIPCDPISMNEGYEIISLQEKREKYIQDGENYAKLFMNYKGVC